MNDHADVKAMLEAKLAELMERAGEIENILSDPGSRDWEDNAVRHEDDEVLAGVGDLAKHEIQEIRLALNQIETGHYGTCTSCGGSIAQERLSALPFATTCIRCA